jgi:hypothetical protein
MATWRLFRLLTFLVVLFLLPSPAAAVPRFGTAEITVLTDQALDGEKGSPNPFTDVSFSAAVTAPSGRQVEVPGFFDGDGQGGAAGRVFKVRVFADETGTWTWRTSSNRADLDGQTGSFDCSGTLGGVFAAGPVELDPATPWRFRYREGPPVYLLAKFLDFAVADPVRHSLIFLSENVTDADREALLTRHSSMRLNKVNVYLANRGDYPGFPTTPWLGSSGANDKTRFDLARWHAWETWILRLRDAGMLAHLWFFADASGFGDLPDADRHLLVRYGMARLSGYVHTMFTLVLEWQEGWTEDEVEQHMLYLRQNNPWGRLVSVHGIPGNFSFPTAPWADFMDLQAGTGALQDDVYSIGLLHRTLGAKPVLQEEFAKGLEDSTTRRKTWAAFFAGAGGSGTGAFLEPFSRFLDATPFEKLEPGPPLVLSGKAYAMAEPGRRYLFYLYSGGTISADLAEAPERLLVKWFDPRTGLFTDAPEVAGGSAHSFTAPTLEDWVLELEVPAPSGGGANFYTLQPCRAVDTRSTGEPLVSGSPRRFVLAGTACGIPAGAQAVAANVTVIEPTASGHLTLWPGDQLQPATSLVNFSAGPSRANNAVLPLGSDGSVLAQPLLSSASGSMHLALDVVGYFQ